MAGGGNLFIGFIDGLIAWFIRSDPVEDPAGDLEEACWSGWDWGVDRDEEMIAACNAEFPSPMIGEG